MRSVDYIGDVHLWNHLQEYRSQPGNRLRTGRDYRHRAVGDAYRNPDFFVTARGTLTLHVVLGGCQQLHATMGGGANGVSWSGTLGAPSGRTTQTVGVEGTFTCDHLRFAGRKRRASPTDNLVALAAMKAVAVEAALLQKLRWRSSRPAERQHLSHGGRNTPSA